MAAADDNDQEGARRLAASGAIGENAYEMLDIAGWAVCFVALRYPALLAARYDLDDLDEILARTSTDPEDATRAVLLLEAVGRRRGALRSGGHVDLERAADVFLRDLRAAKIGRISYERPGDVASSSSS